MVNAHIETILLVTGLATALAIVQCVAPRPILRFAFGVEKPQPVTLLMASHWGLLVFLIGALLVYAAFQPSIRVPAMVIGAVEKLFFAGLVFFGEMPGTARVKALAVADTGIAILYLMYFAGL
ncbi:MAG: hypothetical protein ACLP5H_07300 [Desulfomonilaceae bacterium]